MPFDTQNTFNKETPDRIFPGYNDTTHYDGFGSALYRAGLKRVFDVVLVLLGLIIALPIIAIMALLVMRDGHAPFYTQQRIGKNGKLFRMIKMRTMVHNADALLQEKLKSNPDVHAEWTTSQKLKDDFRITRVGRILRKTSLDELPQLFNVLLGSMSLVGPRPMMPSQKALYPGQAYYRMRPGITGFWQISERNNCEFRDRAVFDAHYETSMSFATDLRVLFQTVSVVLRGTGY